MSPQWYMRNAHADRLDSDPRPFVPAQCRLRRPSVTIPNSAVTMPNSPVTIPKPAVTIDRNTHHIGLRHRNARKRAGSVELGWPALSRPGRHDCGRASGRWRPRARQRRHCGRCVARLHLQQHDKPVSWKTPRTANGSGLFTVRAATRPTGMDREAPQSGVRASSVEVRLGNGVGPSFVWRPLCPCAPPHMMPLPRAFMVGGEWAHS